MRRLLLTCVALAAGFLVAACDGYAPVDRYTGVNYKQSPGEADLQAAYKGAQEMITVSKGNYREPYFGAFERLKSEQERWLKKPVSGGPVAKGLARWRGRYMVLARRIHSAAPGRSRERPKIRALDLRMALERKVPPFLAETEAELDKRRR